MHACIWLCSLHVDTTDSTNHHTREVSYDHTDYSYLLSLFNIILQVRPTMITVANLVAYKMLLGANLGIQASISQCCKPPIMPPCPGTTSFLYANKLAKYQQFIDVIVGDGNCFFRAISKELFGSEKFHNDLRQILTKFTMHNPTLFQALDFTNNFTKHCNRMSRKSAYVCHTSRATSHSHILTATIVCLYKTFSNKRLAVDLFCTTKDKYIILCL